MPTTPERMVSMHIDVPKSLRNRVKAQAAARGMTLAEWLEMAAFCVTVCDTAQEHPDMTIAHAINTTPKPKE
jgi:hypothetical protein